MSSQQGKGKRSIWAVAIVSLIGVASLAYGVNNDHKRIVALQEKIQARNQDVMQHTLSLAAWPPNQPTSTSTSTTTSSSSTSTTTSSSLMTCGTPHVVDCHTTTAAEATEISEDNDVLDFFSQALTHTLDRVVARVAQIESNYAVFNTPITNDICDEIAQIRQDIQSLQYDYYRGDKTNTDLTTQVDALQISVDDTEALFRGHAATHTVSIESRIGSLETNQTDITVDVNLLKSENHSIETDVTESQSDAKQLTIRVDTIEQTYNDLKNSFGDHEAKAKALKVRLENLESVNTDIQNSITTQTNNWTTINTEVNNIQDETTVLTGSFGTHAAEHDKLEARMLILETSSTTMQGEMVTDKSNTSSLFGRVSDLETLTKRDLIRLTQIESKNVSLEIETDKTDQMVHDLNDKYQLHDGSTSIKDRITAIENSLINTNINVDKICVEQTIDTGDVNSLQGSVTTAEGHTTNELHLHQAAESLEKCGGECIDCQVQVSKCTDCRKGHYSSFPKSEVYQCVDETYYVYGDRCDRSNASVDVSKCATDDDKYCHLSHKWNDPNGFAGETAACRTVAQYNIDATYDYGLSCPSNEGLCVYGCGSESSCVTTWPHNDPMAENSPYTMCRCKANDSGAFNPFAH